MRAAWALPIAVATLLGAGAPARAGTIELTGCGVTIPAGQRGVLRKDVECVAGGFVLENRATLDLNGHTVRTASDATVVTCELRDRAHGRCAVHGPGTLVGAKGRGIDGGDMDLDVRDVTFGSFAHAIFTRGRMVASGLTTLPDWANEIQVVNDLVLRRSHVNGLVGASGDEVYVEDVEVGPDGGGVRAGRSLRGRGVLMQGHTSLHGRSIVLRDVTAIAGESFGPPSIAARDTLRLFGSVAVTVVAGRRPVLVRTTCEQSRVFGEDETWGVCSGD